MLCRVEMPSNEQIFGRFYRYKTLRGGSGSRMSLLLMPIVVLIFCVILVFTGSGLLLPLGLAAVLAIYFYYSLFIRPTSLFRAKPGAALQTEITIFTETGLNRSVSSEEGGLADTESLQYASLHMAVETSHDFYLFTSPSQAILIDKEYFTKGSPEDLHTVLQKALGAKFKAK